MSDFLKMDIFFVTTTSVVFLVGIFLLIALYYLIRILRSVGHVADNAAKESDSLREDIAILRSKVRDEGMKVAHFMDFFGGIASRKRSRKKNTKADE